MIHDASTREIQFYFKILNILSRREKPVIIKGLNSKLYCKITV